MFSGPQAVDDERIVFIAAHKGERKLLLYNYVSGGLFCIESTGDNYWNHMRGLSVSDGKLLFSYNTNNRMYKLASIDLDTMQACFNERDFSGGVFNPVSVNGNIYYRARFFSGDGILHFPETLPSLSGILADVRLTEQSANDYGLITGVNWNTQIAESDYFYLQTSILTKPYLDISYMNPLRFWLPLPLIRLNPDNFKLSFDGGGILSIMADPTGRNFVSLIAYADMFYNMAMIEQFLWQSTVPGFPIEFEFSDMVIIDFEQDPYRETRVNLTASFLQAPGRWSYGLALGGGYVRFAYDDGKSGAYDWEETAAHFYYSGALKLSNNRRRQHELFGTGLAFDLRGISITETFEPRLEGMFRASAETRFPLNLTLYGAYDKQGMDIQGTSFIYGEPVYKDFLSEEYSNPKGLSLTWIGGGEFSTGLFSLEIQEHLSHVYYNRFFSTLSLRNILYDSSGHSKAEGIKTGDFHLAQSLVLKFALVFSIIPIKTVPLFFELSAWGAWKFSNTITGEGLPWGYGLGFKLL
jgi:hypothetical protein